MKILITGATGYIGANLTVALLEAGHQLTLLVRNSDKAHQVFDHLLQKHQVSVVVSDLTEKSPFLHLGDDFDAIFHLAAAVSYRFPDEESYWQINVLGTRKLIDFARTQKQLRKLVYVSSVGVYGPILAPPATEADLHKPKNSYELTKNAGELLVKAATDLPSIIMQPTLVYGEGDRDSGMVRFFAAVSSKKFLRIGTNKVAMHPVYIHNLVQALLLALQTHHRQKVFIIGDERYQDIGALAKQVAHIYGVQLLPLALPYWLGLLAGFVGDILAFFKLPAPINSRTVSFMTQHRGYSISKAKRLLGYRPIDTTIGLQRTINWLQQAA